MQYEFLDGDAIGKNFLFAAFTTKTEKRKKEKKKGF